MQEHLTNISEDESVKQRWPNLASMLGKLAQTLGDIDHDIDYDLSGDTTIQNDDNFDAKCVLALVDAVHFTRWKYSDKSVPSSRK